MTAALKAPKRTTEHDKPRVVVAHDARACRAPQQPAHLARPIEYPPIDPCFDHLNTLIAK
jgi:hypothetical protein